MLREAAALAQIAHAPVAVDPACRVVELRWAEPALARAANLLGDDEVDGLEDADVLLEAIERQAERLGELADRSRSTHRPSRSEPTIPAWRSTFRWWETVGWERSNSGTSSHTHTLPADRKPRLLTRELAQKSDIVITMGCGDQCPYLPGKRYIDWDLPDPKGRPIDEVRTTRDEIERRVTALLAELDER